MSITEEPDAVVPHVRICMGALLGNRASYHYGHDVGDRVLKSLVAVVESNIRKYDLLSRWGGDEFFIMLPRADLKGM
ncbi:MAG: diguanylate cyclase, partial [Candidatus Sedimenticola sp. (ex Thyasira tokunagai)]